MSTRTDIDPGAGNVSTLELFFDLVFVFTVTQVTQVIDLHPDPAGIAQAILILAILFWMYGGFAWLTNAMGTDGTLQRLIVLTGMAALFVCSQAIPQAFGEAGIVLGIGFLVLTLVHLAGFLWLQGPREDVSIRFVAPVNLTGALMVLAAGWVTGAGDWILFGGAALLFASSHLRPSGHRLAVRPGNFAERHGLMIIIVLGESIISVALAAQSQDLDLPLITGGLLGVAAIAAMWWAYFVGDDDLAAKHFAAASGEQQSWMARIGYDISHLLMIIGIIGVAAGIRLDLGHLSSPAPVVSAWLVGGGVAVYLSATGLFRWALQVGPAWVRLIAAAGCLGTVPVGVGLGTAQQLGAVAAITVVAIAAGHRRRGTMAGTPGRPRGVVP
ncbi:low temperature requirement protein A [Arthrobacter rhombi]|uniref:Possible low temperature requirement protein A n=1 Tax=Arthrobacter rhombi TaxID=71253 RepID=A0A1R4GRM9_9MICC|nr:low temperature requirement protein A [Arthrobacter rhombi]SJM70532.1 possible low temperature requirement protein A [Arthrobacter rhombi]